MNWDRWPNFSAAEFACKCGCGYDQPKPELMNNLQALRYAIDAPEALPALIEASARGDARRPSF